MPRIEPLGDAALQLDLAGAEPHRLAALAERITRAVLPGVIECVPGFETVTVHYDPLRLGTGGSSALEREIDGILAGTDETTAPEPGRLIEIPVRYGGEAGPDLAEVARHASIDPAEVVRLHAAATYRVQMIGFVPGFPYLSGMDERLGTPRRDAPRTRVPAGSVAIGGGQTGIYPIETPGGWHLIGRTSLPLFDPLHDPPALLRAGDRVRFRALPPEAP